MRHALLFALLLSGFGMVGAAQNSVTIASDPRDLSRPVSTLVNQIREREKIVITYEDPRYGNAADIEDVTAEVSRASDPEKNYGPRILIPKGHAITFVYSPADFVSTQAAQPTIERMLREYSLLGGPTFVVKRDGVRLHILPSEVLDAAGSRLKQSSILDAVISVSPARRSGGELLQAICDQIQRQTGYEVGVGPSAPGNILARYRTTEGIESQSGRAALEHLLDTATHPASFAWDLYYGPDVKGYMLNFSYMGPATPAAK
ncbi:MAG: hypothetical protein WBV69_11340 [Candidatus Sulfotelmatobacter sp.]